MYGSHLRRNLAGTYGRKINAINVLWKAAGEMRFLEFLTFLFLSLLFHLALEIAF